MTMRVKRPLLLYGIVACYVLAPAANIGLFWYFGGVPLSTVISRLFQACGPVAATWLLTAPLAGAAFFFITPFSWWVFVGHSTVILLDTLVRWTMRPAYYAATLGSSYPLLMLAGNLALAFVLVTVCQKDFRAPYLQGQGRGWRKSRRIALRHSITVDGRERRITDISADGFFLAEPRAQYAVGQAVSVEFHSRKLRLVCQGEVSSRRAEGYGVRFLSMPAAVRGDIARTIKPRSSPRRECRVACTLTIDGTAQSGVLRDLSSEGCFIQTTAAGPLPSMKGAVIVEGISLPVPLRVVWSGTGGMSEKPRGIGARFVRADAESLRRLRAMAAAA